MKLTNVSFPVFFLFAVILLFAACEKDDNGEPDTSELFPTGCLLESYTRITNIGNEFRYEYDFNSNGLLSASKVYQNGSLSSDRTYQRDDLGRLERINILNVSSGDITSYRIYEYENDSAIPVRYDAFSIEDDGSENRVFQEEYEYEGDRVLALTTTFFDESGEITSSSKTTYEYKEEADQLVVTAINSDEINDVVTSRRVRTYNKDVTNPFMSVALFQNALAYYALVEMEVFDIDGQLDENFSYTIMSDTDEPAETMSIQYLYLDGDISTFDLSFNCD
jgi:hypothetical protein